MKVPSFRRPVPQCVWALVALASSSIGQQTLPHAVRGQMEVLSTVPAPNATSYTGVVSVLFDRAVKVHSVDASTFRVSGAVSGAMSGEFLFSDGGRRVVFMPDAPLAAGEEVSVSLARELAGRDGSRLGPAGHAFRFWNIVAPSAATFTHYATLVHDTTAFRTNMFELLAGDLDDDGSADLLAVDEGTLDVRTYLNAGDGSGEFGPRHDTSISDFFLKHLVLADFSGEGRLDVCAADSAPDQNVRSYLGMGNGHFLYLQDVTVGGRGLATLDIEGDGDLDLAACGADQIELVYNDGFGFFQVGAPAEGGVSQEFLVESGDMDLDGIADLVVVSRSDEVARTALGSGSGVFTPAGFVAQRAGGRTVDLDLADVDGDGDLDAALANERSGASGILRNLGSGVFSSVSVLHPAGDAYSSVLGDVDGDGDLDWLLSVSNEHWRLYANGGAGTFTTLVDLIADPGTSAAALLDTDGDGDLDLALGHSELEEIRLMDND